MSYVTKQFITAIKLSDTSKFKKTNCSKVERYIKHSKYKRKHGWTNLKKIVIVVWVLITAFQSQSFLLCEPLGIMLGKHICSAGSCVFVIDRLFRKFHWKQGRVICITNK